MILGAQRVAHTARRIFPDLSKTISVWKAHRKGWSVEAHSNDRRAVDWDFALDTPATRVFLVIRDIQTRITGGKYAIGDKLPSERELVAELNASRNTIRKAIHTLEEWGYVQRQGTAGTIVLDWQEANIPNPGGYPSLVESSAQEGLAEEQAAAVQAAGLEGSQRIQVPQSLEPVGILLHAEPPSLLSAVGPEAVWLEVPSRSLVMRRYRVVGTSERVPYQTILSYYPSREFIDLFHHGLDDAALQDWLSKHYEPRAKRIRDRLRWHRTFRRYWGPFDFTRHDDTLVIIDRQVRDAEDRVLQFDHIVMPAAFGNLLYEYDAGERDVGEAHPA